MNILLTTKENAVMHATQGDIRQALIEAAKDKIDMLMPELMGRVSEAAEDMNRRLDGFDAKHQNEIDWAKDIFNDYFPDPEDSDF